MAVPVDVDLTREAAKRAKREIMDTIVPELMGRNIGPEGQTYGTQMIDRADRILMFIEDREMGVHDRDVNGVIVPGTLRTVNPELEDKMQREFIEDVKASPLFGHAQYMDSIRESGATTEYDEMQGVV